MQHTHAVSLTSSASHPSKNYENNSIQVSQLSAYNLRPLEGNELDFCNFVEFNQYTRSEI